MIVSLIAAAVTCATRGDVKHFSLGITLILVAIMGFLVMNLADR